MGFWKSILLTSTAAALLSGCANGNRVLSLNGRTDFGHIPDQPSLRLAQGDFSIAGWIHINAHTDSNNSILSKRGQGNSNGWTLYVAGKTWPVLSQKVIFHVSQGDNPFVVSRTSLNAGEWYHVCLVYSAQQKRMVMYIDGKEDAVGDNITQPNAMTSESLYLGRDSVYPRYFFNGMLDDVSIWSRALAPGEVNQLMAMTLSGTEDGLLACWDFDRGDTADKTGHGFDAELIAPQPEAAAIP
jgi:hypothetical protein